MKLTDAKIKKAKPQTKPYKMADGGGLFLLVQPNGNKWWRYKYRFAGKEKLLALGVYPDVSLKIAREDHGDARKLLANGSDPSAMKQSQKRQAKLSAANSFEVIAREFHALKSPIWTHHHATDWINVLEREVFPKFGHRPITEIEAPDVLDILRGIEARGTFEIRARVLQRVRVVFAYAIASGRSRHNPAAEISGALAPRPKVTRRTAAACCR